MILKKVNPSDVVQVFQKYSSFISGVCHRYYIVGGTDEDLFQEGVIGILEACKSYNGESLFDEKFDSFVKVCIKRQIIDAIRSSNAQKNKPLNESVSIVTHDANGDEISRFEIISDRTTSNDPLDVFLGKEWFNEKLNRCKEKLNDFEMEVLERYLSGEKQSEIARNLNKETKAIDNSIQRIKSKLK